MNIDGPIHSQDCLYAPASGTACSKTRDLIARQRQRRCIFYWPTLSVYQTLFVANVSGAAGSAACPRKCPVNRLSRSIIISSHESMWYRIGLPWFCALLDTLRRVPPAANMVVRRPKGMSASHGTGMLAEYRVHVRRVGEGESA